MCESYFQNLFLDGWVTIFGQLVVENEVPIANVVVLDHFEIVHLF